MRLSTFFSINAIVVALHAFGFILLPSTMLHLYQVPVSPGAALMGQLFGGQLLFASAATWFTRHSTDGAALWAIVLAGLVTSAAGTGITANGLVDGTFGPMGWLALAIYSLFTFGFLYFQLQSGKRAA